MGALRISLFDIPLERPAMEKSIKKQLSLICFLIGIILVLLQDLKGFATIDWGFSWPWAAMFYSGLILMLIGYYLRG